MELQPAERINYLLRIYNYREVSGILPLSSLHGKGIAQFYWDANPKGYWYETWGGRYDGPATGDLSLWFGVQLSRVTTLSGLLKTDNSYLVRGEQVLIHLNRPAINYLQAKFTEVQGYSSGPRNAQGPPDDHFQNASGKMIRFPSTLETPSFKQKLSGNSGQVIENSFTVGLNNTDGHGDTLGVKANVVRIGKAVVDNPKVSDFQTIGKGVLENISADREKLKIKIASVLRDVDVPACRVLERADWPEVDAKQLGKIIPIGWGTLLQFRLRKVADKKYLGIDPNYTQSISAVYDSDGKSIAFTYSKGLIRPQNQAKDAPLPDTADIQAKPLRLGQIVVAELKKANIAYIPEFWDKGETDNYSQNSPRIIFSYRGRTVKQLINQLLKNDLAYLIQKADGRLSLRRVLGTYETWEIPSWLITKWPEKSYSDKKQYASSIEMEYAPIKEKLSETHLERGSENAIVEKYQKRQMLAFECYAPKADAIKVAQDRYRYCQKRREIQKVAVGADLSKVSLLDHIELDMNINGRQFSHVKKWRVTEIDAVQDTMLLEEI